MYGCLSAMLSSSLFLYDPMPVMKKWKISLNFMDHTIVMDNQNMQKDIPVAVSPLDQPLDDVGLTQNDDVKREVETGQEIRTILPVTLL